MLCAQNDSIVALKEVIISDWQLKNFSNTQTITVLNDSIIKKNQPSLTSLLNFNSVIYFKENGLGMVSSPSFRGTTAQQTAVIWNGININSQLLGQTDFNTITTRDFNSITIRSGGGSAIYGSSAIGGSIHLNNELAFKNKFENELQFNYGSFNTFDANYKVLASNEKVSSQVSISRNSSDNNYTYLGTKNQKNENGQFYNTSMNASFGYKLNTFNYLKLYSQIFEGERHFSLISSTDNKTKYQDLNSRNLLEWNSVFNRFTSNVKVAFLSEEYKYFENIKSNNFYFGKVESFISKYDLSYNWKNKITVNTILDYTQNKGYGSSIPFVKREIGSATLLMKHLVFSNFQYELSVRKEMTSNYKSPILFSIGTNYSPFSYYRLKLNVSQNFRIPTYNDLYWENLGNPNLKPESSIQEEICNEFKFKNASFSAIFYHNKIKDMIRWVPKGGGKVSPENTTKVEIYGFEAIANWSKKLGNHQLQFNGTYGYTSSQNEKTGKQLIYVPYHKITAGFDYTFRKFALNYQYLYNGEVYTQSDNNPKEKVDWYLISNLGIDCNFGKINSYKIGFKVLNLFNEKYETVESRPLPGRNFTINLTFKF